MNNKDNNFRRQIEAKLIEKASKDENFRQKLMENPKTAIQNELGGLIPDSVSIKVIEEKENEVCLVIPNTGIVTSELSDVELESVAGGWTSGPSTCTQCPNTELYCGP